MSQKTVMILSLILKSKKKATKKCKIKSVNAAAEEKVRTHGIDRLKLSYTVNESENDSVNEADDAFAHNSE